MSAVALHLLPLRGLLLGTGSRPLDCGCCYDTGLADSKTSTTSLMDVTAPFLVAMGDYLPDDPACPTYSLCIMPISAEEDHAQYPVSVSTVTFYV